MAADAPMLVLDANDVELTLTRDGEVLYAEPGTALVTPKRAVFGREALAESRLHPRQAHNEFWHRLNADAVAPPGPGIANQADLVYRHLAAMRRAAGLRQRAGLIVAAPSATSESQLALLLGIAGEAGFDVRAVVDAAVAAGSQFAPAGTVKLVDVLLHRTVVTTLQTDAAEPGEAPRMRRETVQEAPAAGFAKLLEGWLDAVADRFVEATRFDPLRLAATEQQVHDQVLAALEGQNETAETRVSIEVRHDGGSQQVELDASALARKSAQRYDLAVEAVGEPATVAITHRVSRLPGLARRLEAAGHRVLPLPAGAVASAIAAQAAAIPLAAPGEPVQLVTALPAKGEAPAPRTKPAAATHLLCGQLAVPIESLGDGSEHPACGSGSPLFQLLRRDGDLRLRPTRGVAIAVNGAAGAGERAVHAGDDVRAGEFAFRLIVVAEAAR